MKTIQCAHPHLRNGFVAKCQLWTASGGVHVLLVLEWAHWIIFMTSLDYLYIYIYIYTHIPTYTPHVMYTCIKFYNFIKWIMRIYIHSIFKKPKTNVFILHFLTCSDTYNL